MRKHCLDAGMDCLRWRLYGVQDDARSLRTCMLDDHVYDLNLLIDIYSKAYEHIYLVGHSLGCVHILQSNLKKVSRIVLRDPSDPGTLQRRKAHYSKEIDAYILDRRCGIIVNKTYMDTRVSLDMQSLTSDIHIPTKIIFAGGYNKKEKWQPYMDNFLGVFEETSIDGANHGFTIPGNEEQLFEETIAFLKF